MIRRNSFRAGSVGSSQKVTIRLLDDNEVIEVDFQSHQKGQFLMDYVCRQLNIAEKDYFGLRYVDATKQRHWLDLGKSITKQLKEMTPFIICLRFKFYPGDPMLLKEEVTRYQLVLQLRRDLLHGRLHSSNPSDIVILSAYIVQSELGDYDPEVHTGNYVSEYELVARQSADFEEKVKDLHGTLNGTTPAEADILFLRKAAMLDTYGVDPHPVKEQGEQLFLGINHSGISTFQGSKRLAHYKWSQISKLNYESKMFIVHIKVTDDSKNRKKETAGFKCQTAKACKYLWRCAVEQRMFFTSASAQETAAVRGGGLFGSRFRYSGKVQKEILQDPGPLRALDGVIQRTPLYRSLQRNKTRSLTQSPMDRGYNSLPRSNHSAPAIDTRAEAGFGDLCYGSSLPASTLSTPFGPEHGISLLETLEEDSSPMEEPASSFCFNTEPLIEDAEESSLAPQECEKDPKMAELCIGEDPRSSSAREKRRKFGTASAPKIVSVVEFGNDEVVAGNSSWVTVRRHLRLRKLRRDVFCEGLESSGGDAVTKAKAAGDNTLELTTTFDFLPISEANPTAEDNTLRESKINQVETPNSAPVSGPFVSSSCGKGKDSQTKPRQIILSIWKIFVVCMLCVLVALVFVAILAIEVDIDICQKMRRIPEIELFQTGFYEPVKYFIRDKIHNISDNINLTFQSNKKV